MSEDIDETREREDADKRYLELVAAKEREIQDKRNSLEREIQDERNALAEGWAAYMAARDANDKTPEWKGFITSQQLSFEFGCRYYSMNNEIEIVAIEELIDERTQARADKDFARSDEIRQQLLADNIVLEDSSQGTTWRRR